MKTLFVLLALASAACAQTFPPGISVGPDAPTPTFCNALTVGNIYVRSENPANGPINVQRCTQSGAGQRFEWMSIDHFVGTTLPAKCAVGDIAFDSDATAGQNIFGCTTANTWTVQSSGGSFACSSTTSVLKGDGAGACVAATAGTDFSKPNTAETTSANRTLTADLVAIGATRTAPFKTGTTVPATCIVGDLFFDSDATAGSNLYACTSTNTWTLQSGSGGNSNIVACDAVNWTGSVSIAWDTAGPASVPCNFLVATLTGNTTVTTMTGGPSFMVIQIKMNATPRTLAYDASLGTVLGFCTASTTANSVTDQIVTHTGSLYDGGGCPASTDPTVVPVVSGGTGLTSGTSGGVLCYTASGTIASSAALAANGIVYGRGAGVCPAVTAVGTAGQVLTSNGTGVAPTFQAASGSGYNAWQGAFASTAISGTPTVFWTFSSVPALAAGPGPNNCLNIKYVIWGSTSTLGGENIKINGTTVMTNTAALGGATAGKFVSAKYCNNAGVQNAQSYSVNTESGFFTSLTGTTGSGFTPYTFYPAFGLNAAANNLSTASAFTLTIEVIGTTGNAQGEWASLSN